jgi:hypothetical protein
VDLYNWFSEAVTIVSGMVDIIVQRLLPVAEEREPLEGHLAPDQRPVLLEWIAKAAEVMKESKQDFTRRLPAGEQFPTLLHAAFGFTFALDFIALVDRQVPKQLERLSRRRTRKLERLVLVAMTAVKYTDQVLAPMDTLAVLTRWMTKEERSLFRRRFFSPTDVLKRFSKSGFGTCTRQVQQMLYRLGDNEKLDDTVAIRIDPRKFAKRNPPAGLQDGDTGGGEDGAGDSLLDDDEPEDGFWVIENVFDFDYGFETATEHS